MLINLKLLTTPATSLFLWMDVQMSDSNYEKQCLTSISHLVHLNHEISEKAGEVSQ